MPELKIWGLSEETIAKLTHEAKNRGIPREELLRKILENFAVAPALLEQQDKYNSLLTMITEVLTLNIQEIKALGNSLEKFFMKGGSDTWLRESFY